LPPQEGIDGGAGGGMGSGEGLASCGGEDASGFASEIRHLILGEGRGAEGHNQERSCEKTHVYNLDFKCKFEIRLSQSIAGFFSFAAV
jgi:hypothetical protein